MKKLLSLICALCLIISLASCAAPDGSGKSGTNGTSAALGTGGTSDAVGTGGTYGTSEAVGVGGAGGTAGAGNADGTGEAVTPYTFTDDLGRSVTVESTARVAALLGSYADMWILAGGSVCAAVGDAWEDFDLSLPEDTVDLGTLNKPSLEALLGAEPELVLASSKLSKHLEMKDALEGAGIAVAYLDVSDFGSYLRVLKIMTDITGNAEAYAKYGTAQREKIGAILAAHSEEEAQTVLVMRASASSIRAKNSDDTMLGGMLRDFGCVNIADSDSMILDDLSVESIIEKDPDRIFFIQTGDDLDTVKSAVGSMFAENPLWKELDAVKNGRVYYMDKRLYNLKPNARYAEAYGGLERILYEK